MPTLLHPQEAENRWASLGFTVRRKTETLHPVHYAVGIVDVQYGVGIELWSDLQETFLGQDVLAEALSLDNLLKALYLTEPRAHVGSSWLLNNPHLLALGSGVWFPSQGSVAIYDSSQEAAQWTEGEAPVICAPISILERYYYTLRDAYGIGEFLQRYPFLLPLLLEACVWIKKYFPREEVALEVVVDPEEPDFEELFAYILTDLPPEEALARLRQLDADWWLEAMSRAQGKLCIDVEFR